MENTFSSQIVVYISLAVPNDSEEIVLFAVLCVLSQNRKNKLKITSSPPERTVSS